jgi:hypothetical protein
VKNVLVSMHCNKAHDDAEGATSPLRPSTSTFTIIQELIQSEMLQGINQLTLSTNSTFAQLFDKSISFGRPRRNRHLVAVHSLHIAVRQQAFGSPFIPYAALFPPGKMTARYWSWVSIYCDHARLYLLANRGGAVDITRPDAGSQPGFGVVHSRD